LEDLRELVLDRLGGSSQCYGHCQEPAQLRFLKDEDREVGALVCPSGYVSRLIMYGPEVDSLEMESLVRSHAAEALQVEEGDIRLATRYSLDLGLGGADRKVLREAYWTQNYGKSKSKEPDRAALFMCSSCAKLFVQPASARASLCGACAP
jgi:hypothetical protein